MSLYAYAESWRWSELKKYSFINNLMFHYRNLLKWESTGMTMFPLPSNTAMSVSNNKKALMWAF